MKKLAAFLLLFLPILMFGQEQKDSLKHRIEYEFFACSRYATTFDSEEGDQWQQPFLIRAGLKTVVVIDSNNHIYATSWMENRNDITKLKSFLYYENDSRIWTIRMGPLLPRPISFINRPHPLNRYGEIALRSQDIIPDNNMGLNFGLKNIFGADMIDLGFFEARQDKQRFGEFNFSLNKNWGELKTSFSGYAGPLRSGWAVQVKKDNLSLLVYRNYGKIDNLQSLLFLWSTSDIGDFYVSLIHDWQHDRFDSWSWGWLDRISVSLFDGNIIFIDYGFGIQSEPVVSINVLLMFSF